MDQHKVNYSLSNKDMMELVEGKSNFVLYEDIKDSTMDKLLGKYGCCIILYQSTKNYGHWCCLIRHSQHLIEFFDSYGEFPDTHLSNVPEYYKRILNEDYPYLTLLMLKWCLKDPKNKVEYNEVQYQEYNSSHTPKISINTCGRHVASRILLRKYSLKQYQRLISGAIKGVDKYADELVTQLINTRIE